MTFTYADFASSKAYEILAGEVLPALERAAREEFQLIEGQCAVTDGDKEDVLKSAEAMKFGVCAYIDALAAAHIRFGRVVYGSENTEKSEFGGFSHKGRNCRLRRIPKDGLQVGPDGIALYGGKVVVTGGGDRSDDIQARS